MAYTVYYGTKEISSDVLPYINLKNKPKLNDKEITDVNTSESLNIAMMMTQHDYDILPIKNAHCFYIIKRDDDPVATEDYRNLKNKPAIDGVEIYSQTTSEDLDLLTLTETYENLEGTFQYKGTCATVAELPDNPKLGWVYFITTTKVSMAYNGSFWDALGTTLDTSEYQKKSEPTLDTPTKEIVPGINETDERSRVFTPVVPGVSDGTIGIVPAPAVGQTASLLKSSCEWVDEIDATEPTTITAQDKIMVNGSLANGMPNINDKVFGQDAELYNVPTDTGVYGQIRTDDDRWIDIEDSQSASAISTTGNIITEEDLYYALPTINDSKDYTSATNLILPSTVGTTGQIYKNNNGVFEWDDLDTVVAPVTTGTLGTVPQPLAGDERFLFVDSTSSWLTAVDTDIDSPVVADSNIPSEQTLLHMLPTINGNREYTSDINFYWPANNTTSSQCVYSTGSYANTMASSGWTAFGGASSSAAGSKGVVPAPSKNSSTLFLFGNAGWGTPSASTMTGGTSTDSGTAGTVKKATTTAGYWWFNDSYWADQSWMSTFGGASSSAAGSKGMVPAGGNGSTDYYLNGAGSWVARPFQSVSVSYTMSNSFAMNWCYAWKIGNAYFVNGGFYKSSDWTIKRDTRYVVCSSFKINGTYPSTAGACFQGTTNDATDSGRGPDCVTFTSSATLVLNGGRTSSRTVGANVYYVFQGIITI